MEKLEIKNAKKKLVMENVCMDESTFTNISGKALLWDDVNLTGTKIKNANLSDLEIKGAQLGGAHFQHIGLSSMGHAHHNPDIKHRPMLFENCDMNNSFIVGCDLSGVEIKDCTLEGMKINGIEVVKLLKAFQSSEK